MTKIKKTIFAITLTIILCASGGGIFWFYGHWTNDRFGDGVVLANENLSGKTFEEGLEILKEKERNFLSGKIKFKKDDRIVEISTQELGLKIYLEKTINTIKSTGKEDLKGQIHLIKTVDTKKAKDLLVKRFQMEDEMPKQANFRLEKGQLIIEEERNGVIINEKKLKEDLEKTANVMEEREIEIKTLRAAPTTTTKDLEKDKEEISKKLKHTIILVDPIYSDDWTVKMQDHLSWVEFVQKQEVTFEQILTGNYTNKTKIKIKQEELNNFIDENISKWLDKPSGEVKIHKDKEGGFIVEGEGHDGKTIQRQLLKESIELAIENEITKVTIPVTTEKPKLVIDEEAKKLGIKERISVGHTSFYGSPANRVHNIKTGTKKFNGVVIAPGEIFSFNKTLGEVDGKNGYKMELVIKPEGTIPEYGGGICQVSTTVYRAAMFAGLPITERSQHSYAVNYYSQILGHGLDATIYLGGADLKFKNDTENHILIQGYLKDDYELYIIFYGTSDGREVEMEGPYISNGRGPGATVFEETPALKKGESKQTERAHNGFDALWYRYITTKEGETVKEEIYSKYKAMPAKILIGTGE